MRAIKNKKYYDNKINILSFFAYSSFTGLPKA
jgi:hypothetical protein